MQAVEYLKATSEQGRSASEILIASATSSDFERVYPLLLQFNIPTIDKAKWQRLFINWNQPDDCCGYLLIDRGEVKGFLGLLFSERAIAGRLQKFCNMTSWIVSDSHRAHSLKLLQEVIRLKDHTITNFTPSATVAAILKKFDFAEIENGQQLLFPRPAIAFFPSAYQCVSDVEAMSRFFSAADRRVLEDHRDLDCLHVALVPKAGTVGEQADYCYLILKTKRYRRLPVARVHYVGNRDFFLKSIDSVRTEICWRLKLAGLIVNDRYLAGNRFSYSRNIGSECPAFLKSSTVGADDIDTLYSEMILLHD